MPCIVIEPKNISARPSVRPIKGTEKWIDIFITDQQNYLYMIPLNEATLKQWVIFLKDLNKMFKEIDTASTFLPSIYKKLTGKQMITPDIEQYVG